MSSESDAAPQAGLDLARQWAAALPPKQLQVALQALEPELCREHERRLRHAQLEYEESQARRAHTLYLAGLGAGFMVIIAMLIGAVIVGIHGQAWLAAMLSGPSVIALTTLFALRSSDSATKRARTPEMPAEPRFPIHVIKRREVRPNS